MKKAAIIFSNFVHLLVAVNILSAAEIELRPEVNVVGSEVRLMDVLAGAVDVSDEYLNRSLGPAPALGKERIIYRSTIDNLLRGHEIKWSGPMQCKVQRPSRQVKLQEVQKLITQELAKRTDGVGEVRILELSEKKPFHVPRGRLQAHVRLSQSVLKSPWSSASVRYMLNGQTVLLRSVRFQWSWDREVWQAVRPIQPNSPIRLEDFRPVTRNALNFSGRAFMDNLADVEDVVASRFIPAGGVLMQQHLKQRKLVERGKPVVIHYQKKAISVAMKGTALEDGTRGQTVAVRNESSRKKIFAKVQDAGVLVYEN